MDILERAGVASVRLNEIITFTPVAATLQAVEAGLDTLPSAEWKQLTIGERLYRNEDLWQAQPCLPTRSRSSAYQVLSRAQGELALRLANDGTSTIMRSRDAKIEELIADVDDQIPQAADFVSLVLSDLAGKQGVTWNDLTLDGKLGPSFPLDQQPPYPVFELDLANEDRLKKLVGDSDDDEMQLALDRLLLYLVARNYRLTRDDGVGLEELCDEVLTDVLDDGFLLHESHGRKRLRNLSQGTRVFIAFGRRGTVIVHTRSIPSLPIRCSVLSMVETLRSRFHNLHLASTLMDKLLLRLARLMEEAIVHDGLVTPDEKKSVALVLKNLATASYIYGLAVTDPGTQLLDGSIISIIADRAAEYFELSDLRQACQRKMEAIRTIWTSYQDRRRQALLRALRVMEPPEEHDAINERKV